MVDNFDIVCGDVSSVAERIDIWLVEKKKITPTEIASARDVIAYAFTSASEFQDFPVRGMAVYLHIRRRSSQVVDTGKIFSQSFELTYKGSRLTKELVSFLKETSRGIALRLPSTRISVYTIFFTVSLFNILLFS